MFKRLWLAFAILLLPGWAQAAPAGRAHMVLQMGHFSELEGLAVTPDGRYAVSLGDQPVLWDLANRTELRRFDLGLGGLASCLALSANAKVLGCGDNSGSVHLFLLDDDTPLLSFKAHEDVVSGVAFSPDGTFIATVSYDQTVRLWTVESLKSTAPVPVFSFKDSNLLASVAVSPDGHWLAAGGTTGVVHLWSLPDGREAHELKGQEGTILSLAFSPDSRLLVSGESYKSAFVWDLASFKRARILDGFLDAVYGLAFSRDGRTLAAGGGDQGDKSIRLWDVPSGKELPRIPGRQAPCKCLAFAPDGHTLLAGDGTRVRLWDVRKAAEAGALDGRASMIRDVAFSPDGRFLATAQGDGTARLWDLGLGSEVRVLRGHGDGLAGVVFSADGTRLATCGYDRTARVWDLKDGRTLQVLKGHGGTVHHAVFSPDGRTLFTCSRDQTWRRWNVASGDSGPAFQGHTDRVRRVALSPDGRLAATAADDRTARIWDAASGTELHRLKHPERVVDAVFLPDGRSLLTACLDKQAYLWDVATGQLLRTFPHPSPPIALAVSPDGARIALGGSEGQISILEPQTGKRLAIWPQDGEVDGLAFSPDGRRLASGAGGAARLWDPATGRELARLCSLDRGWVVTTPEGLFDGSPDGTSAIRWTVGLQSFPLEAFMEGSFVPALLPRALGGASLAEAGRPDLSKGFALPPRVRIASPVDGATLAADDVEVTVEAVDQGGGIDEIRLYQNGKALGGDTRGLKVAGPDLRTCTFHAALAEGPNVFRAVALSTTRIESNPAETTVRFQGGEKRAVLHVLAVGIDRYRNESMNLNFAREDAMGVADFFTSAPPGLFQRVEVDRLFDADASKAAIQARLQAYRSLPPQDVAVIYLAGHGETLENTWYFLPFELVYPEREAEVKAKGLSSQELQEAIRGLGAQKVLVLLDACKSGEALAAFAGRGVEDRKALAMLARATGVHVVAASSKDQLASEMKELGHGVFTYTLLQGLKGEAGGAGKGPVTVRSLLAYVESQLPEVSQRYKAQAQYPVVDSRGMDFPLVAPR